tara:strand:- start:93 stop:902 length:810 start_codon:yes stop_codon:yes gene_type:complete
MKIFSHKKELEKLVHSEKNLGFVPTMGSFHKGHISLIKKSIHMCRKTLVSIFVNKPQFNNKSDFNKYPRNLKKDISLLKRNKVDFLYMPTHKEIYPKGPNKKIKISSFGKKLCGKHRPGHFEGVVDVIDRFLKIIKPKKIFLGEKDMQQLKIVEHFVKKNYKYVEVIGCKTIREKNGVAYSSRNLLLAKNAKKTAAKIYKLLHKNKRNVTKKKRFLYSLKKKIYKLGVEKIDYLNLIDINKLIHPYKKKVKNKIFIAYYIKSTRLIDNI